MWLIWSAIRTVPACWMPVQLMLDLRFWAWLSWATFWAERRPTAGLICWLFLVFSKNCFFVCLFIYRTKSRSCAVSIANPKVFQFCLQPNESSYVVTDRRFTLWAACTRFAKFNRLVGIFVCVSVISSAWKWRRRTWGDSRIDETLENRQENRRTDGFCDISQTKQFK